MRNFISVGVLSLGVLWVGAVSGSAHASEDLETECTECATGETAPAGPNRDLLDIGSKVYDFHQKEASSPEKRVPIIAGGCVLGSPYGVRIHPITKRRTMHYGQDIRTSRRHLPLRASMTATVVKVFRTGGSGNSLDLKLENGVTLRYFHMQKKSPLKVGQKIQAGTQVGVAGSTGRSTGIHLHLEAMNAKGERMNPLSVLKRGDICGDAK